MKYTHIVQIVLFFIVGFIPVYVFANSVEYVLDENLFSGPMSGEQYIYSDLHFNQGGNNFGGKILFADIKQLSEPVTLLLSGVSKTCSKQVRGYYINPMRGFRPWPLDQDTLAYLQTVDTGYLLLEMTGGLYICDGSSYRIYGGIEHLRKYEPYYLLAGVTYNFSLNTYIPEYNPNIYFYNMETEGYLFDSYGGICAVAGSGLNVYSVCGDGILEGPETCDEGTGVNGLQLGHCNITCDGTVFAICGNGHQEPTESCDDGVNNGSYGYCNVVCTAPQEAVCDNAIKEGSETCDEGAELNGQPGHCNATCDGTVPVVPSGLGGGGGTVVSKDVCPNDKDCSPSFYDGSCGTCTSIKDIITTLLRGSSKEEDTPVGSIVGSSYSDELNQAYLRAYSAGITTMPTIQQADIPGQLIRKHAAKMISQFAINILEKEPSESAGCSFSDMTNENPDMQYYARLACKLGIMGLKSDGTPDTKFNPNAVVTRAQFGTMLSRLLYGNQYNTVSGIRYQAHLAALNARGIMTKISDPMMLELRGWVMLMFYRISQ